MNKMKMMIYNLHLTKITNQRTGEVVSYCVVEYLIEKKESSKEVGSGCLNSYVKAESFEQLKKYLYKWVDSEYDLNPVDKKMKLRLLKIDNVILH